jgi:hypothetical protein
LYRVPLSRASRLIALIPLLFVSTLPHFTHAQDKPYFVTYSQDMEEPGNLEIETKTALAQPNGGNRYGALATELEYGAKAWWTTELYLDGQTTANESTIPTGFRWENRFRILMKEHFINPVLYVEFENISGADKTMLEVVGHDGQSDLATTNAEAREEHEHEGELKLILSSNVHDWNISENFIAEKNLGHDPWEFGYAVAASRPLATIYRDCIFCVQKLTLGAEAYGGLGDVWALTIRDTSHYIAPVVGWDLPGRSRLTFSPGFGLTDTSLDRVYRVGFAVEIPGFGRQLQEGIR